MIAPTPPMGWNSWNTFGADINESLLRETADAFVNQGLLAAGYNYVVIDDFWEADDRDSHGRLIADSTKFPSGIAALADYVHSKGLKFGIYSCAGKLTCGGKPASFGNEEIDAQTFADWGVDFLKYDFCYKPPGVDGRQLYMRMGQALRATGRPILFSMCEWGSMKPWEWGASAGAHMWRTTGDIEDKWESVKDIGRRQDGLQAYAGPNHWNDPDMLVNATDSSTRKITVAWEAVGIHDKRSCSVTDICTGEDLGEHKASYTARVEPHAAAVVRLLPLT